jgi:hypothetical protein
MNLMKRTKTSSYVSLLILLLPMLLLVTCKKDDSGNSGNGYRIIKTITYLGRMEHSSTVFDYQGDKISMWRGYYEDKELTRSEITYPDQNTITMQFSSYYDSTWYESYKLVYKLAGSHVMEIDYYSNDHGNTEISGKETLTYNNSNLVEYICYSFDSGDMVPVEKTDNDFEGTQFRQSVHYGWYNEEWQEREKIVVNYRGNQVDTVHYFDYEDGSYTEDAKLAFTYDGDQIIQYTAYLYQSGSWIDEGSVQYTYDLYNNLTSIYTTDGHEITRIEYQYERGNGNYSQLNNYYSYYQYGNIFPHPTKAAARDSIPIFFNFDKKIL